MFREVFCIWTTALLGMVAAVGTKAPTVAWQTTVDGFGAGSILASSTTRSLLYVPNSFGVTAVDRSTGKQLFSTSIFNGSLNSNEVVMSLSEDEETLFVSASNAAAFQAGTLETIWDNAALFSTTKNTYLPAVPLHVAACNMVLYQGKYFIDGLFANNGSRAWRMPFANSSIVDYSAQSSITGAVSIGAEAAEDVIVTELSGNVTRINACTGSVVWSTSVGQRCLSKPAYDSATGLVFAACSADEIPESGVNAVYASNGSVAWLSPQFTTTAIVLRDSVVYGVTSINGLFAVATNGTQLWFNETIPLPRMLTVADDYLLTVQGLEVILLSRFTGHLVTGWQPITDLESSASDVFGIGALQASPDGRTAYVLAPLFGLIALTLYP